MTVIPSLGDPSQTGMNGVVQPAASPAALGVGHACSDAPGISTQPTPPGLTTHTCVALLHEPWRPEFSHVNVPLHDAVLVLVHSFELVGMHAPTDPAATIANTRLRDRR
jgi:hypothetical protein